jgi:excinuclease UvrABC nuclease subunit
MLNIVLPEISELKKYKIRPDNPKWHPSTKQFGFKNHTFPKKEGVYFIFNINNELIYIGKTNNIQQRLASHFCTREGTSQISDKTEICMASYILLDDYKYNTQGVEQIYIGIYKPKYNLVA